MAESSIRQLLNILTSCVDSIEAAAKEGGKTYPSLDDPFNPFSEGEQFAMTPAVIQASIVASSAASQLAATLKLPGLSVLDKLTAFHISSALRVATELNVTEVLRDAGPKGLSAKDIAAKVGVEAGIISRVLRLLATHYVFKEVEPNVFANNRLSSMIDTGKPVDMLMGLNKKKVEEPISEPGISKIFPEKYVGTMGIAALIEHSTDEAFKAAAYLTESIIHPGKLPFQHAFNTDQLLWEWIEAPTHQPYITRLQLAMEGTSKVEPPNAIVAGFDWKSLPKGSLVVDVGGGNGNSALQIAEANPDLKFVVQDRAPVIEFVAKPFFQETPEKKAHVESGRITIEAHDFFTPQPAHITSNPSLSIFLLRIILHDWPQPVAQKILERMHEASGPQTRLLIIDQIAPYACPAPEIGKDIKGVAGPVPPPPLLANLGEANAAVYSIDMQMFSLQHGQERTIGEFIEVTSAAGWKIVQIYSVPGSIVKQIECVKL